MVQLLEALDAARVSHALLRGHQEHPNYEGFSDIDMAVAAPQLARFEELLELACESHGARLWERSRIGAQHQYHLHVREASGEHVFLTLDVHTAETCFGVPFFDAEELVADRPDTRGLWVAAEAPGAIANLLGPVLSGGVLKRRHAAALLIALRHDSAQVIVLLERLFGARQAGALCAAAESHDVSWFAAHKNELRLALLGRQLMRAPLRTLGGLARLAWDLRVVPLWRPRGLTVAFIGTDGSGKSTVLECVRDSLAHAFRSATNRTIKLRPGVLPQLDRVVHLGKSTYSTEDCARPHRARPSGALLSFVRAAWYALDYVVGWPLVIARLHRRHSLVLFDRHYYDFLVDPERARIRRGSGAVRFFARFLPRPDAVLVFTADPERVLARKQELTPEESVRQLLAYERLAADRGFHLVRTDGSIEEAVGDVLDALFLRRGAA